jgi:hypothetical protein
MKLSARSNSYATRHTLTKPVTCAHVTSSPNYRNTRACNDDCLMNEKQSLTPGEDVCIFMRSSGSPAGQREHYFTCSNFGLKHQMSLNSYTRTAVEPVRVWTAAGPNSRKVHAIIVFTSSDLLLSFAFQRCLRSFPPLISQSLIS